jgi:hypothetical protein
MKAITPISVTISSLFLSNYRGRAPPAPSSLLEGQEWIVEVIDAESHGCIFAAISMLVLRRNIREGDPQENDVPFCHVEVVLYVLPRINRDEGSKTARTAGGVAGEAPLSPRHLQGLR